MEVDSQVENLKHNIGDKELSRYRAILTTIINNPPKNISIGQWDDEGDLTFAISMTDIGLSYQDYHKYADEIFSYFVVDFLGELIIREHLELFVEKLQEYDINDYMMAIIDSHKRFGVKTAKGDLIFKFHVSLLKNILTEDLREILG